MVYALTVCELVKIDEPRFFSLIAETPSFARTVMRVLSRRLRHIDNKMYRRMGRSLLTRFGEPTPTTQSLPLTPRVERQAPGFCQRLLRKCDVPGEFRIRPRQLLRTPAEPPKLLTASGSGGS